MSSSDNVVEVIKSEETFPISTTNNPTTGGGTQSIQAIGSLTTGGVMSQSSQQPHGAASNNGNGVGQKRATNSENGGPASKRANINDGQSGPDVVQIKVLIPSSAVGALIGKGGETMRNLKNESGCRVQMSKNQEVYHGTNERICLVKGRIPSAMIVMRVIMEKIQEKLHDSNHPSDMFDLKGTERSREMKFVVPNTSAGMVIGKSGSSIKEIREQTTANIQVYPKQDSAEAKQSSERVITVGHESPDVLIEATQRILEKVLADPHHASATDSSSLVSGGGGKSHGDMSHSSHGGGAAYGGGGHSDHAQYGGSGGGGGQGNRIGTSGTQYGGGGMSTFGGGSGGGGQWQSQASLVGSDSGYGGGMVAKPPPGPQYGQMGGAGVPGSALKFNPLQGTGNSELLTFLDNLQSTLRSSGFAESSVSEIMTAMQVLAKYNIMGLGLGLGVAAMAQMRTAESQAVAQQNALLAAAAQQSAVQQQQQGMQQGRFGDMKPAGIGSLLDGPGADQPYWR